MVLAGFELTSQVVITDGTSATIDARGTDTARIFIDNSLAWFEHWTREFPTERGFHPWDSAAIAWITHRELFTTEPTTRPHRAARRQATGATRMRRRRFRSTRYLLHGLRTRRR